MDIQRIYKFLKELSINNDRDWFAAHKDEYEWVKSTFEELVQRTINRLSLIDPSVMPLKAKDCTYRIYRDIRFSKDKRPFKNHLGAYINSSGKKSFNFGYYLHLEPGNSLIGGGSICLPTKLLYKIRENIYNRVDEYIDIVEDKEFKQFFPMVGDDFLKTAPKGFPKDFEYIDYLKCKEYICSYRVDDSFFCSPDYLDRVAQPLEQLKRLGEFIDSALDND